MAMRENAESRTKYKVSKLNDEQFYGERGRKKTNGEMRANGADSRECDPTRKRLKY